MMNIVVVDDETDSFIIGKVCDIAFPESNLIPFQSIDLAIRYMEETKDVGVAIVNAHMAQPFMMTEVSEYITRLNKLNHWAVIYTLVMPLRISIEKEHQFLYKPVSINLLTDSITRTLAKVT